MVITGVSSAAPVIRKPIIIVSNVVSALQTLIIAYLQAVSTICTTEPHTERFAKIQTVALIRTTAVKPKRNVDFAINARCAILCRIVTVRLAKSVLSTESTANHLPAHMTHTTSRSVSAKWKT
jgi:hypothetical protein